MEDRKTKLVMAAAELLSQHGEAGFNLREVANAVGIKLASLQYHFPTKADLVGAVLKHILDAYVQDIDSQLAAADPDPKEQLKVTLRALSRIDDLAEEEARLEIHLWSMALNDRQVSDAMKVSHRYYLDRLTALIEAANAGLDPMEARQRAVMIASVQEGSMLFMDEGTAGLPHRDIRERVFQTTLKIAFAAT
ncbi:MAG: TetR family transcriptional regulator [Pseudomonadota bacterium]